MCPRPSLPTLLRSLAMLPLSLDMLLSLDMRLLNLVTPLLSLDLFLLNLDMLLLSLVMLLRSLATSPLRSPRTRRSLDMVSSHSMRLLVFHKHEHIGYICAAYCFIKWSSSYNSSWRVSWIFSSLRISANCLLTRVSMLSSLTWVSFRMLSGSTKSCWSSADYRSDGTNRQTTGESRNSSSSLPTLSHFPLFRVSPSSYK